jgi:two-component system cell cycle sensor histidine kinase/response regulator CckA
MSGQWQTPGSSTITKKSAPQTPRVLLVDKDASSAETGRKLLEELGYRVTACATSAEALSMLHSPSEQFNCVISDLSMPGISGLELANTSRLCRPQTPFVLACGDHNNLPPDFLQTLGISGFLLKPFSLDRLSQALHRALADRRH